MEIDLGGFRDIFFDFRLSAWRSLLMKANSEKTGHNGSENGTLVKAMNITTRRLTSSSVFYLLCALILMCAIFAAFRSRAFLSAYNASTVFSDSAVLMIMAMGQMFVITTAGIDLSVGSVLVFSGVIANMAMVSLGGKGFGTVFLGFLISVSLGLLWGWLNGLSNNEECEFLP